MPRPLAALLLAVVMVAAPAAAMAQELLPRGDFLAQVFGTPPAPSTLWLTAAQRDQFKAMGVAAPRGARVPYWRDGTRSAWVLEEVGKELPITVGIVVDGDAVARVAILAYRESHGGEVRYPAFTRQFDGRRLSGSGRLDGHIDNITGATLSVRAVGKTVQQALALHRLVMAAP